MSERLYRLLLHLYPPAFRKRFEAGLMEAYRARSAEERHRGAGGRMRLWAELGTDLLRTVPTAWGQQDRRGEGRPVAHTTGERWEAGMDGFKQDLGFAVRTLRRAPGFTAIAVLTLAIGIGATSAVFGVVRSVLLRPLPYGDPEGVVTLWSSWRGFDKTWLSLAEVQAYTSMTETLDGVTVWSVTDVNFTSPDAPERVAGVVVTPDLVDVLRIRMAAGRFFTEAEGREALNGPAETVVLSHEAWLRRYDADPRAVGRLVEINGRDREIVGVLPAGFRLPTDYGTTDVTEVYFPYWVARDVPTTFPPGGGSHFLHGAARLKAGATPEAALADVRRVVDRVHAEFGAYPPERAFAPLVLAADDDIVGTLRPALQALLATVVFVLLIACANVANLHLTRARSRESELAVRAALGAGRQRIVRQLLTESVVLATLGGAGGLALAWLGVEAFRRLDPGTLPRVHEVAVDGPVVAFSVALTLGTVLLFGILPALGAARRDLRGPMHGRSGGGASSHSRWQGSLVAVEMGLAVVLVIGAGLMVRTFDQLTSIDPGFDGTDVLSLAVSLPTTTYATPQEALDFHREALRRIEELPGVLQAAGARILPLASQIGDWGLTLDGYDAPPDLPMNGDWQFAAPGYFEVMGIPVHRGRSIRPSDDENAAPVVVVNEAFVRHFWPDGSDPIGRRMAMNTGAGEPAWLTIVGVVGDVTHNGLTAEIKRKFYVPLAQWHVASGNRPTSMRYLARTVGDPAALAGPIRDLVRSMDPTLAVAEVRTVQEIKATAVAQPRFTVVVMGAFSLIAATLAIIGIVGVVSYGVSQRVREIGIRMALGAEGTSVVRLMLRRGVARVLIGLAGGTLAALGLTGFLRSLLYNVPPTDPATFVTVVVGFGAVALAATWIPSRRAARVDPVRALKAE